MSNVSNRSEYDYPNHLEEKLKRMNIQEFMDHGYLQEVNRQFFHPLGLALEVVVSDDEEPRIGGVWDYRDDPEGIYFDIRNRNEEDKEIDESKERQSRRTAQYYYKKACS